MQTLWVYLTSPDNNLAQVKLSEGDKRRPCCPQKSSRDLQLFDSYRDTANSEGRSGPSLEKFIKLFLASDLHSITKTVPGEHTTMSSILMQQRTGCAGLW